jgi:hypothetical protein
MDVPFLVVGPVHPGHHRNIANRACFVCDLVTALAKAGSRA